MAVQEYTRSADIVKASSLQPGTRPVAWLVLPQALRYQIYHNAGVLTNDTLLMEWFGERVDLIAVRREVRDAEGRKRYLRRYLGHYLRLRCVSRALADDVTAFLCANNEILLCCQPQDKVSMLLHAPVTMLRSLRQLTIHLNKAYVPHWLPSDHSDVVLCGHYKKKSSRWSRMVFLDGKSQPLLQIPSPEHDAFLSPWRQGIERMSTFSDRATSIHLALMADTADAATALAITQPLHNLRLASCIVSLGDKAQGNLANIAMTTVAMSTGRINQLPFRFFDLPEELQLCVLSHTDLVTPHRQVHWLEDTGYWLPNDDLRLRCGRQSWFCSRDRTTSPPCQCFRTPLALYLVSQSMRRLARMTFYSSNRFIFAAQGTTRWDLDQTRLAPDATSRSAARTASQFLLMARNAGVLPWIREIELIFDDYDQSTEHLNKEVQELWSRAIDLVKTTARNLTIRLYLDYDAPYPEGDAENEGYPYWKVASSYTLEDCSQEMLGLHKDFLQPLAHLQGLARLFIGSAPPWCYEMESTKPFRARLRRRASLLERMVMGPDYDTGGSSKGLTTTSKCLEEPPPGWLCYYR